MNLKNALILIFTLATGASVFAAPIVRTVECALSSAIGMNRFTVRGSLEITDKNAAAGEMSLTTQMAGTNTSPSDAVLLNTQGSARKYPAGSLGAEEVSLVRLTATAQGRIYSFIIASGLSGPQSTLNLQGIPFRAECKLK